MTLNSTTKLSCAELAIYIVLLQPTLWLAYKHGKAAILAFLYLTAFQILRIVAAAIQISNRNKAQPSEAGAIVSSVGLSPLILSYLGFVNLLWSYYGSSNRNKLQALISEVVVHAGAIAGIAVVAVGATKLFDKNATHSEINTGHAMFKAGAIILVLTWIILGATSLQLFFTLKRQPMLSLLMVSAWAFIGVRAVYSVVYAFDESPSLSPFTGTFVVKLVLIVLVQLFATLSMFAVALLTRNAGTKSASGHGIRHQDMESRHSDVPLTTTHRK
ncbi:hypothetical protein H2200_004520 [Cladophialophora chaetospira]|uniref:DUF7702 domain-containing protein n=1 Tax=Cladophialophora chaetospira TaxID=386627 RepID=A0AA38XD95_9EURO|nr:hypothetical protein H2200_004520 [Cladophialophora chaetospira]